LFVLKLLSKSDIVNPLHYSIFVKQFRTAGPFKNNRNIRMGER